MRLPFDDRKYTNPQCKPQVRRQFAPKFNAQHRSKSTRGGSNFTSPIGYATTKPPHHRNALILMLESASKVCEMVIYRGNAVERGGAGGTSAAIWTVFRIVVGAQLVSRPCTIHYIRGVGSDGVADVPTWYLLYGKAIFA